MKGATPVNESGSLISFRNEDMRISMVPVG